MKNFLPNWRLCTILKTEGKRFVIQKIILFLLVFISCVTFHSIALADTKELTAENYRAIGYEAQQKGNVREALTNYAKAIALGLHDAIVFNDMAVLYEQVNMPAKAERYYVKAVETDRNYLPPYLNLGYFYLSRGYKDRAFKYLKVRYEQAEMGDPWAEKAKDEIIKIHPGYKQVIDQIEAKRLERQIQKDIQDAFIAEIERSQSYFKSGEQSKRSGDYAQAIQQYDLALELTPNNRMVIDAKKRAVVELSKENVKRHSERAMELLNSGDALSAKLEFQKLLTVIPNERIILE